MRVLTIGHSYAVAGNRATMRALAMDPEFEITLAAPATHRGDLRPLVCEPEPHSSNLKLVTLPAYWTSRSHIFHYDQKSLRELSVSAHFDVIHMWEEPYVAAGYQIARTCADSASRFCYVTCQNLPKSYLPPFNFFETAVLRKSHGWIAIGSTVLDNCIARGYPPQKGKLLPLAVDTEAFRPKTEAERAAVRRKLNLSGLVIGFVGRLVPVKGLRVLMRALERIECSTPWSLLLLGSGEMESEIQQWACEQHWTDRVRILLVKHHEVAEYLPAMDLLVAPSQTASNWREQFGRMLIEAFASGVPVIASDSGEIPYLVGDAGAIVAERDVGRWSSEITRYLQDPKLRSLMAAAGLERVRKFSVGESVRMHKEYFLGLTGSRLENDLTGADVVA